MVEPAVMLDPLDGIGAYGCYYKLINNCMSTDQNQEKSPMPLKERADVIFKRFAQVKGIPIKLLEHKEICKHFNWSPGKWAAWRRGDTADMKGSDALHISQELGLNYDWLVSGEGEAYSDKINLNEAFNAYGSGATQEPEADFISKTQKILSSNSVYAKALESNIDAFYSALKSEEDLQRLRAEKEDHDKRIATLEDYIRQLPHIREAGNK